MFEVSVVEMTFSNPREMEAALADLYKDNWRLITVTNFLGRNWMYLERERNPMNP